MKVPERCGECVIAGRGGEGREGARRGAEPSHSLGLVQAAARPLAEEAVMGSRQGGPLLEGSETGYKRPGAGRKSVSLNEGAVVGFCRVRKTHLH